MKLFVVCAQMISFQSVCQDFDFLSFECTWSETRRDVNKEKSSTSKMGKKAKTIKKDSFCSCFYVGIHFFYLFQFFCLFNFDSHFMLSQWTNIYIIAVTTTVRLISVFAKLNYWSVRWLSHVFSFPPLNWNCGGLWLPMAVFRYCLPSFCQHSFAFKTWLTPFPVAFQLLSVSHCLCVYDNRLLVWPPCRIIVSLRLAVLPANWTCVPYFLHCLPCPAWNALGLFCNYVFKSKSLILLFLPSRPLRGACIRDLSHTLCKRNNNDQAHFIWHAGEISPLFRLFHILSRLNHRIYIGFGFHIKDQLRGLLQNSGHHEDQEGHQNCHTWRRLR